MYDLIEYIANQLHDVNEVISELERSSLSVKDAMISEKEIESNMLEEILDILKDIGGVS